MNLMFGLDETAGLRLLRGLSVMTVKRPARRSELPTYTRWGLEIASGRGRLRSSTSAGSATSTSTAATPSRSTGHCHPQVVAAIARAGEDAALLLQRRALRRSARARPRRSRAHRAGAAVAASSSSTPAPRRTRTRCGWRGAHRAGRDVVTFSDGVPRAHGRTRSRPRASRSTASSASPTSRGHRDPPVRRPRGRSRRGSTRRVAGGDPRADPEPRGRHPRAGADVLPRPSRALRPSAARCSIYDEVQTGFGRTGHVLLRGPARRGARTSSRSPRASASGVPAGVVLVREEIAARREAGRVRHDVRRRPARLRRDRGDRRGHPRGEACSRTSARVGSACARALARISGAVREVRGEGYLLGVEPRPPGQAGARGAPRHAASSSGGSDLPDALRLLPPLVLAAGGDRPASSRRSEAVAVEPLPDARPGPDPGAVRGAPGAADEEFRGGAREPRRSRGRHARNWSSSTRRCARASRWRSPSRTSARTPVTL